MNILLISPNTLTVPYPVYPIGLDYVAGSLADRHQVRIADMNSMDRQELAHLLLQFCPDVIGLSCRNIDNTEAGAPLYFIDQYRDIVTWLRRHSKAVIVCGGSGFTLMPEEVFAALGVDFGIQGEGERFALFLDALEDGREVHGLPGVLSAGSPGEIPPPWDGVRRRRLDPSASHSRFYLEKGGMLNLQSKRGCSFRCIYCPYPHIEGKTHRLSDPDEVAETALRLQKAGARYLFFTDSALNSDIQHSLQVAEALCRKGVTVPWGGFFAPLRLPTDYFKVMKKAGLQHVEFGTESLSESMLKRYRKPFGPQQVIAAHNQALEAGLHVAHYFLLGGPGESRATLLNTLENIELLKRSVFFFFIGIRIYPHTQLYDIARAERKISSEMNLLEPVFYQADEISRETMEELVTARSGRRINWIIGSGGARSAQTVSKMHDRGYTGPLWEYLIR